MAKKKNEGSLLKSFTRVHNKEVNRVRGIVKRLVESGYDIDKSKISQLYVSHTNKLKNVTRKSLIQGKYVIFNEDKGYYKSRGIRRKAESIEKIKREKYDSGHNHIPRGNVYKGSDASVKMDLLEKIAQYGADYSGDYAKRGRSAAIAVNKSGDRILTIVKEARMEYGDEECVKRLEEVYGSINRLAEILEGLVLAVYDNVYSEWSGGRNAYNTALSGLANALDVTDPNF